jgi:hypothetical protein
MDARPYSTGPLSRWNPTIMNMFPARGGSHWIDSSNAELLAQMHSLGFKTGAAFPLIRMCLFAPPAIQHAYNKAGGQGIVMRRVPGLAEALGVDPDAQTSMRIVDPTMDLIDQINFELRQNRPKDPTR